MGNAVNTERIYINDTDLADYGAKALRDSIKVGGTTITNDYFQGRNRTYFTMMSTTFGLKSVSFTLVYEATSLRTAMEHRSRLEVEMFDGCEIYLNDGFYYRCMLDSIGEAEIKGVDGIQVLVQVSYKLMGIQHDPLVTITDGSSFIAKGTMPKMDCRLSVTVGATAASYTLGGAVFENVQAGDVLVFDGILKRFLKNGAPTTAKEWISFPYVIMGQNAFTALDPVTVEFYPCYL
jgi:hypothetical protein